MTPDTTERTADAAVEPRAYRSYTLGNLHSIPQMSELSEDLIEAIEVVGHVLPFKTNNYVVDELIDWSNIPNDPFFVLNFPQREMLLPEHYGQMKDALDSGADKVEVQKVANAIRMTLNPHPAGQLEHNVPVLSGRKLQGMQHKYRETVLFFPSQGQTCHAYCSFCFRWPQFVGMDEFKFAMKEGERLVEYLHEHPEVSDVLFTGGDPMVMSPKLLESYVRPLLEADLSHLVNIRFGTKSLSYWPYKFVTDKGHDDVLGLLSDVTDAGKQVAIMGHFSHFREMETPAVKEAIRRIRATGANIRSQSPLLRNINDDPDVWARMWTHQVRQGVIPYYLFVVRDTGAQHYFKIPLVEAWETYRKAYQQVSGLARTVRGPSMSADPGKVQVLGVQDVMGEKVCILRFLQARNPDWVHRPFLARFDPEAIWLNDLEPAFAKRFFWEDELAAMYRADEARTADLQSQEVGEMETDGAEQAS